MNTRRGYRSNKERKKRRGKSSLVRMTISGRKCGGRGRGLREMAFILTTDEG